jgi:flagellar biosynthetic protein FliR
MGLEDILIKEILIFSRILGFFILVPFFSISGIPNQLRIGIILFISLITYPMVSYEPLEFYSLVSLIVPIGKEIILGLGLGFVTTLLLSSLNFAGQFIDIDIGYSMVSVISPTSEEEIPVTANLFYIYTMIIVFITDFHHILIELIINSFNSLPLGSMIINDNYVDLLMILLKESFELGMRFAAPILIFIFSVNIILGLLSKAMPGMNVFMLGMPMKIFVGLILLFLILPMYFDLIVKILENIYGYTSKLIGG